MQGTGRLAAAIKASRLLSGGLFLLAMLVAAPAGAAPPTTATLTATYVISIGGLTVGRADVKSRFNDKGYAAAINGSTWGISRIVSDARAVLAGSGRIIGDTIVPASYNLETAESGFETHVRMAMRGGSVVSVQSDPQLLDAPDRVPLTPSSKQNVVDPVGAFVVALDHPGDMNGERICDRTVRVFDGWVRFDIRLAYKETKQVSSGGDSYNGDVIVCSARYVPVAGHRTSRESVQYMADNQRLEVWLAPVAGTNLMVPYYFLIGTQVGDLTIHARSFVVTGADQQASGE